jgi:dimethylamine/trimethylamine dehydrogenase
LACAAIPRALAEAGRVLGGRVVREAALPGMREYIRVRDWREGQIAKMRSVEVFRESRLTAEDVLRLRCRPCGASPPAHAGAAICSPASGSNPSPDQGVLLTPDDIMDGPARSPAVVYDADGYYMGGVIAERLRAAGLEVTLVTPTTWFPPGPRNTGEGWRVPGHLMGLGIRLITAHGLLV